MSDEASPGALLGEGSGVYVGLIAGHRVECVDCHKQIKVAAGGFLARHRVWPADERGL